MVDRRLCGEHFVKTSTNYLQPTMQANLSIEATSRTDVALQRYFALPEDLWRVDQHVAAVLHSVERAHASHQRGRRHPDPARCSRVYIEHEERV